MERNQFRSTEICCLVRRTSGFAASPLGSPIHRNSVELVTAGTLAMGYTLCTGSVSAEDKDVNSVVGILLSP
jgi:hypothetical protein